MCNLYSITTNQAAIIALFRVVNRYVGNLAPMPGVFPDYKAPIVRNGAEGRELATARWGMPSSQHALMEATKKRAAKLEANGKPVDFAQLLRMEPDGGTTNIRNVKSKHWTRWLGAENRCVVPFNSFSEFAEGGDIWFALDETRPLACFAGIWTNWTSVRKVKEGETTNDIYAFLTTEPNAEVGAIHPKAMPVIMTTPDEVETWMTASPDEALHWPLWSDADAIQHGILDQRHRLHRRFAIRGLPRRPLRHGTDGTGGGVALCVFRGVVVGGADTGWLRQPARADSAIAHIVRVSRARDSVDHGVVAGKSWSHRRNCLGARGHAADGRRRHNKRHCRAFLRRHLIADGCDGRYRVRSRPRPQLCYVAQELKPVAADYADVVGRQIRDLADEHL
jgi:putative SOS response-associated peptidase YedK